jgi:hypothetical protein
MKRSRRSLRALAPAAALVPLLHAFPSRGAGVDVDAIVRYAAERQREAERRRTPLVFDHVDVMTDLDAQGRPKSVERHLYVSLSEGKGVVARELVAVDGRPSTESERRKVREEDEKRRRARAGSGSADQAEDADLISGRLPLSDLLERFDFRFVREEPFDGRPAYLVSFGPKPGRVSRTIRDRVLDRFGGLAWIDAAELQVIRIEGRLTKGVKVAAGLALDLKGVELVYEGRPVAPGLWQPCLEELRIDAKAALVIPFRRVIRFEFSNYRAHATGSLLVATERTRQAR